MDNKVHQRVERVNEAISAISARMRKNLVTLDRKYSDITTQLSGLREMSKMSGHKELDDAADFFGKRFNEVARNLRSASIAQLKMHKARLQNLHGLASDSLRGTPEMRGFSEQYDLVMRKLDGEIKSRKQLTFRLGDFLRRNSMDAVSITAALTTRNPLIGLGVRYIMERRRASKEFESSQRSLAFQDSALYQSLLKKHKDKLNHPERIPAPKKGPKFAQAQRYKAHSATSQQSTAEESGKVKVGVASNPTIKTAEFWDIPNASEPYSGPGFESMNGPRLLGPASVATPPPSSAPKPKQEQAYNYDQILSWARAQKRVSTASIQRTFKLRHDTASKILQRLKGDGIRIYEPPSARVLDMVPFQGSWEHNPAPGWFGHQSEPSMPDDERRDMLRRERGIGVPRMLSAPSPGSRPRDGRGRFIKVQRVTPNALVPYNQASVRGPNDVIPLLLGINQGISSLDKNLVKFHKEDQKSQEQIEEDKLESDNQQKQFLKALTQGHSTGSSKALVPAQHGNLAGNLLSTFVGAKAARYPVFGRLLGGAGAIAPAAAASGGNSGFGMARMMPAFGGAGGAGGAGAAGAAGAAGSRAVGMSALGLGGSLLALAIDAILGWFKACAWGTSKISSAIGGMLGGTLENKMLNTFANMSKFALVGATFGSAVPGIGTLAGGILGAAFGGIMGLIGGKNIAQFADRSGLGRMVASFFGLIGSAISSHFKKVTTLFKVAGLGFKFLARMLSFMYDTFIGPITKIYDKTLGPILKPGLEGLKKVFGFFTDIFDWTSKLLNQESDFDKMVDELLSNDNIFEDVLSSFQQAFLDFAAGLLEKVPSWIPGSGFLRDTAKGFRKQSEEIAKKTQSRHASKPAQNVQNAQPASSTPVSAEDSTTSGAGIPLPPKIADVSGVVPHQGSRAGMRVGGALPLGDVGEVVGPAQKPPNESMSSGQLSQAGLDAIKRHEGFSATPYWDNKGYSIGYGHLMTPEEYRTIKKVTREQAEQLLLQDTQKAQSSVNSLVKVPITQDMFDALTSFTYNLGAGALKNVVKNLNAGDYAGAAKRMQRYVIAGGKVNAGLVARRKEESGRFMSSLSKPQQGRNILNMQKQNEDGRAALQSRNNQPSGNVLVSSPKTTVSNTAVLAPQQNPRNTDSTFRDVRYRNS